MAQSAQFVWSEPAFRRLPSPYYSKSHLKFAAKVRHFVDTKVTPFVGKWEECGELPSDLRKQAYAAGVYCPQFSARFGGQRTEDWDTLHLLLFADEIARCGSGGVVASLWIALQIGLSPVMQFGSEWLKREIGSAVLCGDASISLAVSEPSAGSDVAAIKCTAVTDPTDDGVFIVNGEKYFITNGAKCDYYTTAVKTPLGGLTFVVIPRKSAGVWHSRMPTQGWWLSNTAHVVFRDVRVSKKLVVGEESKAWKYLMANFNTERFFMSVTMNRFARDCLSDALAYAKERHTFGKALIRSQVIRHKFARMARKVESTQALLESVAFATDALRTSDRLKAAKRMAAVTALAKVQCSKTMQFCAREAVQIFGGRGYVRNGRGARVERIFREVRVNAIGGGSEEIMLDLAVKRANL